MTFSHPLTTYFLGAAAAFGLMGMAEAIRKRYDFVDPDPGAEIACPECKAPPFYKCKEGCGFTG